MRANLDKDPAAVAGMFDSIAGRYDRTNRLLTFGADAAWRRATCRAIAPRPGDRILDAAAGTGASSVPLARAGARVTAVDFSPGMIALGRRRHADIPNEFVDGDLTALPFADDTFAAVTISFGLRNVNDIDRALGEFLRVTRPGGRLVVCEMSHPTHPVVATGYRAFQRFALPVLARLSGRNAAAYDYLVESTNAWPTATELAHRIRASGWTRVEWRPCTLGVVALHRAVKAGTR